MARPPEADIANKRDFIEMFENRGIAYMKKTLGVSERNILARRARIEKELGRELIPFGNVKRRNNHRTIPHSEHTLSLTVANGTVLVGGDLHVEPGVETLMFRAFVAMHKEMEPAATILNGDVFNFGQISRHPRIGWEHQPDLIAEIEWAVDLLDKIPKSKRRRRIWTLGNHDSRFETRLAMVAPEYANLKGLHLKDHFTEWEPAWATLINSGPEQVLIKHRYKGGEHALLNNLKNAGNHMVTNHLHRAEVRGFTYYGERTIWGCDPGMLAEPRQQAFVDYTEAGPKNWRSGFAVLTFIEGRLLPPELCLKFDDDRVQFRGRVWEP